MKKRIVWTVFLFSSVIFGIIAIGLTDDETDRHFKRGVEYTNLEKYDDAICEFTKVITNNHDYADAYLSLGIVYVHKKMDKEAVELLKKAIDLDPKKEMAYFVLAKVYEKMENDDDAILMWKKFLTLSTDNKQIKIAEKHLSRLRIKK